MSWQVCPLCNGEGFIHNKLSDHDMGFFAPGGGVRFTKDFDCTVCNGKKIISEVTGLPPHSNSNVDALEL